jgi:hypothetical protein
MSTWLLDTPLFNMLATPKAKPLLEWCEANDASLFISAVSLTHIAQAISKLPGSQSQRAHAQRNWFDEIITGFVDRIHPVDAKIATQAGALLPSFTTGYLQHRFTTPCSSRQPGSMAMAWSRAARASSVPGRKRRSRLSNFNSQMRPRPEYATRRT